MAWLNWASDGGVSSGADELEIDAGRFDTGFGICNAKDHNLVTSR
jgi:hypothetical protein